MKTKIKLSVLALTLVLAIGIQGCRKDKDPEKPFSSRAAQDNAAAEEATGDVAKQVQIGMTEAKDSVENSGKSTGLISSTCATITITPFDTVSWPKTIVIDFGTTGCVGSDGNHRKGIINIVTTGWYRSPGTVITITTVDYYVNNNKVEVEKTITNNGRNSNNNLTFSIVVNGTKTTPDGTTQWSSQRTREWIAGELTFSPWDDEYLVTGTQNGTTISGETYNATSLTPLHRKLNCKWFVAGTLKLISSAYADEIIVDYGDGTCDAIAVATYLGNEYTITMQ